MTEPRIALVTTTINVPTVLKLYAEYARSLELFAIFVAGDLKTPEQHCADLVHQCGPDAVYLSVANQKALGYKCSELIGWNTIGRRNIATLAALKWGAEIIVTIDDDNVPMDDCYFESIISALHHPFSGVRASGPDGWFDVGQLLNPIAPHRGMPLATGIDATFDSVVNARAGVAAGICLGDPDIAAYTRMARAPMVHQTSKLLDRGIVVSPHTKTVFNSQNTAFIRELAPAMFMLPGVGRYDDIFASLICQRIMRERDLHVHFGQPFVWQQRNVHNLVSDLKNELLGMEYILEFASWLDAVDFGPIHNIGMVRELASGKSGLHPWMPHSTYQAWLAWCDDIERVMG